MDTNEIYRIAINAIEYVDNPLPDARPDLLANLRWLERQCEEEMYRNNSRASWRANVAEIQ